MNVAWQVEVRLVSSIPRLKIRHVTEGHWMMSQSHWSFCWPKHLSLINIRSPLNWKVLSKMSGKPFDQHLPCVFFFFFINQYLKLFVFAILASIIDHLHMVSLAQNPELPPELCGICGLQQSLCKISRSLLCFQGSGNSCCFEVIFCLFGGSADARNAMQICMSGP